jgi:catalase
VVWDEAVKINGADNDFHRRDLWEAIESGDYPEYEFGVQVFDEAFAEQFDFDVLDSTKLIPEELVPVQIIGKMVLDRNVGNFFAESEQVAFHPANIVPGIDFSEDPLLQGRLFSYQDTQLIRLGGPNFHQIPINMPKCPMRNFQRDGHMQMAVPKGRANYEPNTIDPASPREDPKRGFVTVPVEADGPKLRVRSETFADHYSQARMFYRSLTEPEQRHMASAFAFELGKVETLAIRTRMLGHLMLIDPDLGATVEAALGMEGQADTITPAREPIDVDPSPALSILAKALETIEGRKVGVLVSDGVPVMLLKALVAAIEEAGAKAAIIAPKIGGVINDGGKQISPDHALSAAPSVFFDAVVLALSDDGAAQLATEAAAVDFVRDAFSHLKVIGYTEGAAALLQAAGIANQADVGVVPLGAPSDVKSFIGAAKQHRIWEREPKVRSPG